MQLPDAASTPEAEIPALVCERAYVKAHLSGQRERARPEFVQRPLKVRFASRFHCARDANCDGFGLGPI